MDNVKLLNPAALAFVGDAVYSLKVRTLLADKSRPADTLHKAAVEFVSAGAQAKAFAKIKEKLTDEELEIFTRGRNFHTNNTPKSSSPAEYHTATGLETLFGFLHLSGKGGRIDELFNIITDK
ncbi:MAG: ribonuclease III [Clostridia bacterium]|nr:ribonuclease III [Clostridia bacterium]